MASAGDEDLVASKTDGFKVGEKKTVEEYAKLGEPFSYCIYPMVRSKRTMDDALYLLILILMSDLCTRCLTLRRDHLPCP